MMTAQFGMFHCIIITNKTIDSMQYAYKILHFFFLN